MRHFLPAFVVLSLSLARPVHAAKDATGVDPTKTADSNELPRAATVDQPVVTQGQQPVVSPCVDGVAGPDGGCGTVTTPNSTGSETTATGVTAIGRPTIASQVFAGITGAATVVQSEAQRQADAARLSASSGNGMLTSAILVGKKSLDNAVASASKPVVIPPAATPVAAADRVEVSRLAETGSPAEARQFALAALERTPNDPALLSFVKLTEPARTSSVDQKTVSKRVAELAAGMRQDEGSGGALLASPISFGALSGGGAAGAGFAAAGARGPAAMPAGLGGTVPDIHGAAALRDASGKIAIKDFAGAETALTRRIAEAPKDGGAFRLRALTRRFMNRYADSADDAQHALAIDSRDSRSLHLLSRDLTDLGRPKEGLVEADRALAIDSKDAQAYIARSAAFGALGRGEEELSDLAHAASLDSQFDALYHDTLAIRNGGAPSRRSWPVWIGAVGTALLFFSFALFRKRGDSSVRMALRKEDHDAFAAAAPRVDAVPKGFRVVKTLGQGGMGVVYEAVDLGLQRTVALKKLRPEIADNPRERTRFLKEARTVAGLKHPNIVEIHAIHEDAEGLFIVFERVPGESLHERLGRGPVNHAEAAAMLKQIASALDYAHGQGVVHQDLKPANVMIHAGLAKVMDFGIARRVQETLSTMSKIEVSGTPAYMSPEQEQGVVTPSADVFALGACAYETLTGSLPFPTGGMMLKAQKMYRKPSEASAGLRPEVDAAIARALEPRPEDRWPSASSFVDALSRALA
jgi:hypothetical protein